MTDWKPISGETPLDDISGLKIRSVKTRTALNAVEAENIRLVVIKYMSAKPTRRQAAFDLHWLKSLHGEMFGRVWVWAGERRLRDLNLGVPPNQIESQLYGLLGDLEFWEKSERPMIEQAAMLHHRAVAIHPFLNGNGRWSRMLANIWLILHDHPPTDWPEDTLGNESTIRQEYLAAIRSADGGDYGSLIELHRRFTPSPK